MSPRKLLVALGRKRKPNYVRVFTETFQGTPYVRAQWKEDGKLRTASWDDTRKGQAEAKAFAEGVHERLSTPTPVAAIAPITLRALWEKYALANEDALAKKGFKTTASRWRKFEIFAGRDTIASTVTLERMDEFKKAMVLNKHSVNQVALHLGIVRMIIRWGVMRDLLPATKVTDYRAKFSKEARLSAPQMAEYSRAEATRILATFDPRSSRDWRPWVMVTLLAYAGPRVNASLHLEWPDVDFERATVRWRPEHDKMGRDRVQPVPPPVLDALWVAYGWRQWAGYTGRFVFFGVQRRRQERDEPWTYQAFVAALHAAADHAKVPRLKYRAAHGFRRGVAGDVLEMTGSSKRAAQYIGDADVRVVERHYIKDRPDELRDIADKIGGEKE